MAVRFVRPVSSAAFLARRLALGAFLLLLIAVVSHRFGPLPTPQLAALVLLSAAIAALSVPLALRGLMQLWTIGALGGVAAAKALFLALPPLLLVGFCLWRFETMPRLFDLTTDIADPPTWVRQPQADQIWLKRPMFVTSMDRQVQKSAYPGLSGRRYEGAPDRVYEAVMKVAKAEGMQLRPQGDSPIARAEKAAERQVQAAAQSQEPAGALSGLRLPAIVPVPLPRPDRQAAIAAAEASSDVLLQGSTRTLLLGIPFDVVLRLREEEETTLVDLRIAARYGAHDLGFGAGLAESFLRALDAEMLGIATQ
ncbi:DUF1499 domain-containing protein [Rhizobium sp. SL86]|uniref:DUF1499 domain-containing protein n=1 Tax=Rhizobium sp. SL86 TaxID=2995148 RepID=UPI0022728A52|nr:DUF1499 domain-containing protein [Rhizobium sp. SL86]MCY1664355.1 DUF1499 domain-containing protein [Rhizobium sp. SL86]